MTVMTADFKKTQEWSAEAQAHLSRPLDRELHFTEVYRQYEGGHPYELEAQCLRAQLPAMLGPIQGGDEFAGRYDRMLVGTDPEEGGVVNFGYYCRLEILHQLLESPALDARKRREVEHLIEFWTPRRYHLRCRAQFPPAVQQAIASDDYYCGRGISYPMYGLGGPLLDYHKLVRLGITALRGEVLARQATMEAVAADEASRLFFQGMLTALDLFTHCAQWYARQAREQATGATDPAARARLERIAGDLEHIGDRPPQTYSQAVQLVWLYSIVALPKNYGRLDVTLGDHLVADLDSGRLTWEQARDLTAGLWRLMVARGNPFNNRVIIGGVGRPNPAHADRFARLALEVQGLVNHAIPQLTLRWHAGMDRRLWDQALEVLARGSTHPMLYNDDVNVPAAAKAFGVSVEEAQQYLPYGCGEYVLEHRSIGSPDAAINVAKALEATLFDGVDARDGSPCGLATGGLARCGSFEQFQEAYARQLEQQISALAEAQAIIYRVTGVYMAYPFLSLLYDDCLSWGKPLLAGGVRYAGGTLESFGNTTAADSLMAIKKVVFDDRRISQAQLLECLRSDFAGHEAQRALLRAAPKFGNDDDEADGMCLWLNGLVCDLAIRHGRRVGLDSFLTVLINNGDHVLFGTGTAATPDGRHAGQPLSNGNQPSAGGDTQGVTALLNSMAKLDPSLHAGAVHNLKLSRPMMTRNRAQVSALIDGYFAAGGTQVMVTVTDRGELEAAMKSPEKYGHLFVRVGGYSAKFVDLTRDLQMDIVRRTLY